MGWNDEGIRKQMVGKVVVSTSFKDGVVTLRTDDDGYHTEVEGDCCSFTWIENAEIPETPFTIASVEDIPMPEWAKECIEGGWSYTTKCHCSQGGYHDSVAHYGHRITTTKGERLEIDFRNDSNGYYGGSLDWVEH
jgi:hypothetical protein